MSMYAGVQEELITLVKAMYSNFKYAVLEEGETSKVLSPVQIKARVHHVGCFYPPVDWIIMNRTTEGRRTGM